MKKIIIPIIIVVIALVAAPFVTGKIAEQQIQQLVEQQNQSSLEYGTHEILSYDRSLFNTHSEYRYTLPIQYKPFLKGVESIEYQCDIDHGFLGISYQCTLINNQQYLAFVNDYLDGKDPFSMYGMVNALSGLSHTIAVDEINGLEFD